MKVNQSVQPLLDAQNISFAYQNEGEGLHTVLENLSLSVRPGEMVAVLGHNGSGKSTLAKHFNAILLPQGGVCYVDGIDTSQEERLLEIRQQVGMVFQNPDNQIVATIVEEDVAFGPENLGIAPEEIRRRVDTALESVGMEEFKLHAPHQLSGGQKQRIAIAGVIAMLPRCIVLDEPTAMLDPRGRREVMKTIRRLNQELGITVVFITHYMDEAAQCDRVVVVDEGRLLFDDLPSKVFSHVEELKAIGLDVPQITALLAQLRGEGIDLPLDCIQEEEGAELLAALLEQAGVHRTSRE